MLQRFADSHELSIDQAAEEYASKIGIARYGRPDDIANAIAFLFAPESQWINGTSLRVDGGETKVV
jgi:3-oxoacyl-[acyl-carrier protein] reductase